MALGSLKEVWMFKNKCVRKKLLHVCVCVFVCLCVCVFVCLCVCVVCAYAHTHEHAHTLTRIYIVFNAACEVQV